MKTVGIYLSRCQNDTMLSLFTDYYKYGQHNLHVYSGVGVSNTQVKVEATMGKRWDNLMKTNGFFLH